MKTQKIFLYQTLLISAFLLFENTVNSQTTDKQSAVTKSTVEISKILIEEGFQSVVVQDQDSLLYISYENRVYRFEATAMKVILNKINEAQLSTIDQIVLVPKRWNIPVMSVEISLKAYQTFKNNTLAAAEFSQKITVRGQSKYTKKKFQLSQSNTGSYRLELEAAPQLRLALGGYPDAVAHQFNLIPRANLYLWKGAKLTAGLILPITNEFEVPEERMVRPEILTFNQYFRLPSNIYAGLSVGYFTKYRYGGSAEIGKFFLNNNLVIKGKIGYTGYASYPKRLFFDEPEKGWQRADVDYLDYQVGIDYRLSKWDVTAGVTYGKALFDKDVLQVHLTRQINEMSIQLYAYHTNDGENYGVQLSLPIFPKKYWKPKRVSVRPARQFQYNYNGTRTFVSLYKNGASINDLHFQLNPSFIKNQLLKQ